MDRKKLLAERQKQHKQRTENVTRFLNTFLDEKSFVENNEFFADDDGGESIVCGQASIGGNLVYVIAQNSEVMQGGMNVNQAKKFLSVCGDAFRYNLPIVFVLDSCGAKICDGIELMDFYSQLIDAAECIDTPKICIVKGNALGNMAMFASICDFIYMTEDGIISLNSPSVILANENSSSNVKDVFGKKIQLQKTGICSFNVIQTELNAHIAKLLDIVLQNSVVSPDETELNRVLSKIEKTADTRGRLKQLADKDTFIEIYPEFEDSVITGFAKIGGYPVALLANNGSINQGKITKSSMEKIIKFSDLNARLGMYMISVVDCIGLDDTIESEHSTLLSSISNYIRNIKYVDRISLIVGNAIGAGYTLFASKGYGQLSAVIAWENAVVAPVKKSVGGPVVYQAEVANAQDPVAARNAAIEKYETIDSDPYIAAQKGLIDNVVEAKNSRLYLISKLQAIYNE